MNSRTPALALLLLGVLLIHGPEHLAASRWGTLGALEYVSTGMQLVVAWGLVAALLWRYRLVRWAALWLMAEAALRPACRLALPMHQSPAGSGSLCSQATGTDLTAWLGILAIALVVRVVWRGGES